METAEEEAAEADFRIELLRFIDVPAGFGIPCSPPAALDADGLGLGDFDLFAVGCCPAFSYGCIPLLIDEDEEAFALPFELLLDVDAAAAADEEVELSSDIATSAGLLPFPFLPNVGDIAIDGFPCCCCILGLSVVRDDGWRSPLRKLW